VHLWSTVVVSDKDVSLFTWYVGLVFHPLSLPLPPQFEEYASDLVEGSLAKSEDLFKSFESLSQGLMAFAEGANQVWPFVTLPLFEAQVDSLIDLSTNWVSLVPLVEEAERQAWEAYTVANHGWIQESLSLLSSSSSQKKDSSSDIIPYIFRTDFNGTSVAPFRDEVPPEPYYAPTWQTSPAVNATTMVNFNQMDNADFKLLYEKIRITKKGLLSVLKANGKDFTQVENWPQVYAAHPVYESPHVNASLVGLVTSYLPFHVFINDDFPEGANGIILVLRLSCDGNKNPEVEYSYQVNGPNTVFLGAGNRHSRPKWTFHEYEAQLPAFKTTGNCTYSMHIFPSDEFFSSYNSSKPAIYTAVVVLIYFLLAVVFTWYDCSVDLRQDKVVTTAARTTAIVDSFFPSHIRDRIMNGEEEAQARETQVASLNKTLGRESLGSKPIADLFPNASVMFADIVGFTAWSSTREPAQVFTLLETIYNAFDKIAKRRRVFKVETIGDCYVAATGLPDPREDHAIIMCRFARDCLFKMQEVVNQLEISLGPDTAELGTRFGINSGPVTGGVLRGDKSRFQLFGDTVNTAARVESTGTRNKIHLSSETANLLKAAGMGEWVELRKELVQAKGKTFAPPLFC
jgi:class 3 adenylate cyclase